MITYIKSTIRKLWERFVDPLPRLRREAEKLRAEMEKPSARRSGTAISKQNFAAS